jgi:leader peptidase (prepilin peptidase)/N-methyltransferase
MPHLMWLLWFAVGSFLGSFLNVCIYRLPREQSVVRPRSRCPGCKRTIVWYDNIPLLSFALLGAACRHCKTRISWRYPLVEALTGVSTVVVLQRFGVNPAGLVYVAFVAALIAASFVDLEFQIIPDEISVGGLVVGVVVSGLVPALHGTDSRWLALGRSGLGLLAGGGILYVTAVVGDFIFRKESMGGGDIKLLAMAGSILGWKLVLLTFFIAPIFALIPGLLVLLFKKSHIIPYGPFLSIGLVVSLFAGNTLLQVTGMEDTIRLIWMYYKPW